MSSPLSIASVTVAMNSARVLPTQLDALLRQDRPLQEIIVVDNASTDDTASMLARQYPQITVLRLPENVGVGGGFAAALKYAALEKNHDWVWLFDDDTLPPENGLASLLAGLEVIASDERERVGVLAP